MLDLLFNIYKTTAISMILVTLILCIFEFKKTSFTNLLAIVIVDCIIAVIPILNLIGLTLFAYDFIETFFYKKEKE